MRKFFILILFTTALFSCYEVEILEGNVIDPLGDSTIVVPEFDSIPPGVYSGANLGSDVDAFHGNGDNIAMFFSDGYYGEMRTFNKTTHVFSGGSTVAGGSITVNHISAVYDPGYDKYLHTFNCPTFNSFVGKTNLSYLASLTSIEHTGSGSIAGSKMAIDNNHISAMVYSRNGQLYHKRLTLTGSNFTTSPVYTSGTSNGTVLDSDGQYPKICWNEDLNLFGVLYMGNGLEFITITSSGAINSGPFSVTPDAIHNHQYDIASYQGEFIIAYISSKEYEDPFSGNLNYATNPRVKVMTAGGAVSKTSTSYWYESSTQTMALVNPFEVSLVSSVSVCSNDTIAGAAFYSTNGMYFTRLDLTDDLTISVPKKVVPFSTTYSNDFTRLLYDNGWFIAYNTDDNLNVTYSY